ncbi:MAG: asparagine synthase-related protein [Thermoplasmatota archaeon]
MIRRDATGRTPLWVTQLDGRWEPFADLEAAIAAVPDPRLDLAGAPYWIHGHSAMETHTIIQGVRRIPSGHQLVDPDGPFAVEPWWQPDPSIQRTPQDAATRLRSAFDRAMAEALEGAQRPAAMMTGGFDSTTVAAAAIQQTGGPIRTYSWLPRDIPLVEGEENEVTMGAVADELGAQWTPVHFDHGGDFQDQESLMVSGPRNPFRRVLERAKADGCDVILSGVGGDEFASFGSLAILNRWMRTGRWLRVHRHMTAEARRRGHPWSLARTGYILARHFAPGNAGAPRLDGPWLRPAVAQSPAWKAHLKDAQMPLHGRLPIAAARWWMWRHEVQVSRMEQEHALAAKVGIRIAYPLRHPDVIEAALQAPADMFLQGGTKRGLFRRAMADLTPRSVAQATVKLKPPCPHRTMREGRETMAAALKERPLGPWASQLFDGEAMRRIAEADLGREQVGVRSALTQKAYMAARRLDLAVPGPASRL